MTYSPGPREGAHATVRLEDQPLPDRETPFHTPRAGDWLLLAVLIVALLGIGARVWSQLGFGDPIGRAIFFGLLLLAVYWTALVYVFKLSLTARVGPQGLAIVRGPWRIELRWSEIARLMERPQATGGRRYRWVVALARDGRRIQIREDALLDYERYRREVYQRYRVWRDHGGSWGATGGGPFVARESVGDDARWWAFTALIVAAPGAYLALLLPALGLAGLALLAVALLCLLVAASVYLRRRTYAIDGRMIETRGALQRVRLAWRDVAKVDHTRSAAGGVILMGVVVGRLALRLAARGDAGIRTFAWSPRAPELLIVRGGGRQARIRLHRLAQPEELVAWVEFYTGTRRAGSSRPLETAGATAPRRSSPPAHATPAPAEAVIDARAPDLTGASGPVDPWGSGRQGEPVIEPVYRSHPSAGPAREAAAFFPGAPTFHEPQGLDEPPAGAADADQRDEAWLRETNAHASVSDRSREPVSPRDAIADAHTVAAPTPPEAAPRRRQTLASSFAPPPAQPRPPMPPPQTPQMPPQRPTPAPRPAPPYQPARPSAPRLPDMPFQPAQQSTPHLPDMPAARRETPAYTPPPAAPTGRREKGRYEDDFETEAAGEMDEALDETPAPWRQEGWQPPVLPRFGPTGAEPPPRDPTTDDR